VGDLKKEKEKLKNLLDNLKVFKGKLKNLNAQPPNEMPATLKE